MSNDQLQRRYKFLDYVEQYIAEDPEAAAFVADRMSRGIQTALREARSRAADMEVALAVALAAKNWRNWRTLVANKLEAWKGKTSNEWTSTIKELRELVNGPKD